MEKDNHFSKTLTIIPDDLIFANILPRLPVKPLVRFKSVSKPWNYAIRTPQFVKSHLQFSSSLSPHFLLQNQNNIYTLSYDQHNNLKKLVKLEHAWDYNVNVIGCCNGLICLYLYQHREFYSLHDYFIVWNPATRQHRKVSSIPCDSQPEIRMRGFGYYQVGSTDDYKIIAGFNSQNCLWVFSLRVGNWKRIDFPSDHPVLSVQSLFRNYTGIHIDGTLYWSACVDDSVCIYSFSLNDEQFNHEDSLSKTANMVSSEYYLRLFVFNGCLSFIWDLRRDSYVFVMKQQGDSTLWRKFVSVPHRSIPNVISLCVGFSVTGKCLFIQTHIDRNVGGRIQLKLVDPTLEDFDHSQGIGFEHVCVQFVHQYVESLVSPLTLM